MMTTTDYLTMCLVCGYRGDGHYYHHDSDAECPLCGGLGDLREYDADEYAALIGDTDTDTDTDITFQSQFAAVTKDILLDAAFGLTCIIAGLSIAYALGYVLFTGVAK